MKKIFITCLLVLLLPVYVYSGNGYRLYDGTEQLSSTDISQINTTTTDFAVTSVMHVSPNGNNSDGSTWANAYTTIQTALNAASIDTDDCTLILISPHTTNYDINTTGDPTFAANVILMGTERNWAKIKNTHASATSILKFTGKAGIYNLNFNLGTGSVNGIIITHGGYVISNCQFVGTDLTGAATAIHIDGATTIKHGVINKKTHIDGHVTHMTGILLDNASHNHLEHLHIDNCLVAIQAINTSSDENDFEDIKIGGSALGLDIDAGNEQHFDHIDFYSNTANIDDEVGDHFWHTVNGHFQITTEPDNFTGVTVATGDGANTWTAANVTLRAAAAGPFRIIGLHAEADATEKFRLRLKVNGASVYFADIQLEGNANVNKREALSFPSGTEFIFNKGAVIEASSKSESAGIDNVIVWLEIQEI